MEAGGPIKSIAIKEIFSWLRLGVAVEIRRCNWLISGYF